MAVPESRSWWQDGVLGRLDPVAGDDLVAAMSLLGSDGLGLDGAIVSESRIGGGVAALSTARDQGLRVIVELAREPARTRSDLTEAAETWMARGVAGFSLDIGADEPAEYANVTPIYGTSDPGESSARSVAEVLRPTLDQRPGHVLLGRRRNGGPGHAPAGIDLVVETVLLHQPWRAPAFAGALDEAERALSRLTWPAYALGAPRRGPFAIGLPMDEALACSAAMHLTLRGTPCIELGGVPEVPADPDKRAWYRRLIDLRRREPALHRGGFRRLNQEKSVLGYLREFEAERLAVLLNLGRRARGGRLPTGFSWTVLLGRGVSEGQRLSGGEVRLPGCGVVIARAGAPLSRALGGSGQRRASGR